MAESIKDIKDLLFDPTRFTIEDVRAWMSDIVARWEQVDSVLKKEVFDYVKTGLPNKETLPSFGVTEIPKESNMVVLWGKRDAGKTSLIGSILSIPGFELITEHSGEKALVSSRYDKLKEVFRKDCWQEMPNAGDDNPIEVVNTVYKPNFIHSYPISFVEVNCTKKENRDEWEGDIDEQYLERSFSDCAGHIHLFCLDCSPDSQVSLQESLDRQVDYFIQVINNFKYKEGNEERNKLLDTASAVYVVVTKADLMNAPETYLDNAVQTLVTSSLSSFWQIIRNYCKKKEIYDVQPLTSSVGKFALKDFAKIKADYTKRLFHKSILKKCYRKKFLVEQWLDYDKWWIKWIVIPLVALFVLWNVYNAYEAMETSPTSAVVPFDYAQYFKKEMNAFRNAKYDDVRHNYGRLYYDLVTERTLRTDSGEAIIPDSVGLGCDSLLTATFAPILHQALTDFFNANNWSQQTWKMSHLKYDLNLIGGNRFLSSKQKTFFAARQKNLNDDLQEVNTFIADSKNCKSLEGIKEIEKGSSNWKQYPFINDSKLNSDLSNAVRNAANSCTEYYLGRADDCLSIYNSERSHISKVQYDSSYERDMDIYNAKMRLQRNTSSLISDIDNLRNYIKFDDMKSKLERKEKEITDITHSAVKPTRGISDYIKEGIKDIKEGIRGLF